MRGGHVGVLYGILGEMGVPAVKSRFGAKLGIGFQVLTVGSAPNLGASSKENGEQPQCGQAAKPDT